MTYDINSSEEREYLEDYNIEQFERPSVATDIVAFAVMQEGSKVISGSWQIESLNFCSSRDLNFRTKVPGRSPEVFTTR